MILERLSLADNVSMTRPIHTLLPYQARFPHLNDTTIGLWPRPVAAEEPVVRSPRRFAAHRSAQAAICAIKTNEN
jgi:hypothetical protein